MNFIDSLYYIILYIVSISFYSYLALFDFYEYPKEMHYKLYDRKGRSLMGAAKSGSKENNKGKFELITKN